MSDKKKASSPTTESVATVAMYSGDLSFMNSPRIDLSSEKPLTLPKNSIVVMGVPFDTSTSNRPGTRLGPRAVRIASKMLSWQRLYDWKDDLYQVEVANKNHQVFDGGDVLFDFGKQPGIIEAIEKSITRILKAGAKPLTIGGDHFISFPILSALKKFHFSSVKPSSQSNNSIGPTAPIAPSAPIALVQFDAHSDTWSDEPGRIDHGTGFYHAVKNKIIDPKHSVQIGIRTHNDDPLGIKIIDGFEIQTLTPKEIANHIKKRVGKTPAYFSLDIDSLDPAYAPGTGTPVIGGMTPHQILSIMKELTTINWIGGDVVEVSPPFDHGEITALAGATIAGYLGHLLNSNKR